MIPFYVYTISRHALLAEGHENNVEADSNKKMK